MKNKLSSLFALGMLIMTLMVSTGCKPVKILDVVEIKSNETAWVVPLDAASKENQKQFNSIAYLDDKKVATKRIMVDKVERSIGRFWFNVEWIPAVRVIVVDRSLVTREWTDNDKTGTTSIKQGIPVNTKDNIKLLIGLTVTVSIDETDASTYLYYHGARQLSSVTDENIRGYAVAELSRQVSSMTLIEFQQKQTEIYSNLFKDAVAIFKPKGVTVQYLGNSEGWTFIDHSIQESINKSFITQQENKTAQMEQVSAKTRNETAMMTKVNDNTIKVLTAQAEADAARKLLEAKDAAAFQNELTVALLTAKAKMEMATKWDGKMPSNILPEGSPLLMNLGDTKK